MKYCSVCHSCFDDEVLYCHNDDHPPLDPSRFGRLDQIGGYLIEDQLELDTRKELFRARHVASGRSCLIKFVGADAVAAEQFLKDAEVAASLLLSSIADVYETGRAGQDEVYIVSEDTSSQTLRDVLDSEGTPELLKTIRLMTQTAKAVHALHLAGLQHFAIRPENILISSDVGGGAKIRLQNIDLGGVIWRSIVSNKFTIDTARYELRYFAPELFSNEAVGIKSDVYALGIVLYELLTGHPPFDSTNAAGIIERHRTQPPPEVRINDFDLRMLITHTLMESLSKRPENRQSSADAFARQLRHIEQLSTHVSTPPPATSAPPWPQKAPAIAQPIPLETRAVQAVSAIEPVAAAVEMDDTLPATTDPTRFPATTFTHPVPTVPARTAEADDEKASFPPASSLTRFKRRIKRLHPKPTVRQTVDAPPATIEKVESPREIVSARKIELPQLDEDLPTMDDVAAALSETPIEFVDLPDTRSPLVVSRPVKDIPAPSVKTLPVANLNETQQQKVSIPQKAKPAISGMSSPVSAAIAVAPALDADEITVVRPRSKPIRVNIESPRPPTAARQRARSRMPVSSPQLTYVPTLLGASPLNKENASAFSLFGSFKPAKRINLRGYGQSAAIVGGILVAASVFLFNTDSLWRQSHSLASSEQPSAEHSTTDRPDRSTVPTQTVDVKEKPPVVSNDQKIAKNEPKVRSINNDAAKETVTATKDKTPPAAPVQISQKPTAVKSVSNEKLFQTQRIEIPRRGSSSSSSADANKPTATTRPRIVKAP